MLDAEVPALEKVIMEAFPEREPKTDLLVMPVSFNDVGECYTVLLRLRTKRTRYIAVFLPGKSGNDWSALEALYEHAPSLRLETVPHGWDSRLYMPLGYDPLYRVRKGMQDRFMPTVPRPRTAEIAVGSAIACAPRPSQSRYDCQGVCHMTTIEIGNVAARSTEAARGAEPAARPGNGRHSRPAATRI
jgi:hypothetical protein